MVSCKRFPIIHLEEAKSNVIVENVGIEHTITGWTEDILNTNTF